MKGERDEGKQMVPLFPGLRISDGDKGGPRAPPRNKMALFEEYSVTSQGPELRPVPRPLLPSGNGCGAFVSQASSSNVVGVKRKVRPVLAAMNECPRSPEVYHSLHLNGVLGATNYPNPASSTNLMMKAKCAPVQPPYPFSSYNNCTDENDFGVSPYINYGKMLSYGNLQLHVKKEKNETFSSKQSKEAKSVDHVNLGEEQSRLSQNNYQKYEPKSLHKSKTVGDDISAICGRRRTSSFVVDSDSWALRIGDSIKREETSDGYTQEDSIPGLDPATDEVVRVIGQRLFLKARKTMIHQQKLFSLQMFELHRLITVQRHIAKSPEILHENAFDSTKSPIKFPPINKLLYVSPLDQSPSISKPKLDPLKSNLGTDFPDVFSGLEKVEKGLLPHQKPLPNPPSIPIDPKLAPFCLPVPTGNQWLVPVRSPSEGLIYKPYPGPCFPSASFMGPVYGNCPPVGLSSFPSNEQGNEINQSYLQSYPMPMMNSSSLNLDLDKGSSSNYIALHQPLCKRSSGAVASEGGGTNLHRSNGSEMQDETTSPGERAEGDALSLFPTTPSCQKNEQRVHAIKVVPHNRTSASASAARIFQSIQEERRKQEIP